MAEVVWTDQVFEDIDSIAEFIARDSLTYAFIQTARFFERAKILESTPLAGRVVPEINRENIRELVLGSYRMIYRLESEDRVTMLTVHHSKRSFRKNPVLKTIRKRKK